MPRPAAQSLAFCGQTASAWRAWRRSFAHRFREALALTMRPVPLQPRRVSRETLAECVREKWVYRVEQNLSASAWICRPLGVDPRPRPAVLCVHGEGPGKDPLIGLFRGETCLEYHKRVSVRLAQAGFVTLTPDRRGYGDCSGFPNGYPLAKEIAELDAFYQRTRNASLLALNVWDALRAVDLLRLLEGVNPERIGVLGVEAGGVVAAATGALHPSVQGIYLSLFLSEALQFVGLVQLPRLMGRAGPVELCGLVCPKPLGIQIIHDDVPVRFASAQRASRRVAAMYRLAGCPRNFSAQIYEGFYEVHFPSIDTWFQNHLLT